MSESHRKDSEDLVTVYRAPDEVTANLVKGLLEGEGIPVTIKSEQVPWMDGVMRMGKGYWGDVVVPEEYADRSREIIQAYEADSEKNA